MTRVPLAAPFRVERVLGHLRRELRVRADRSNGRFLRNYLGSPLPVLGVRTPEFKRVLRPVRSQLGSVRPASVRTVLVALWRGEWFEERAAAIELLSLYATADEDRAWVLADGWVDSATGWALSDALASGPVARMLAAKPARFTDVVAWTRSDSFWRRRAATYALHDWVFSGNLGRPFRLLRRLVRDPEFWVQRAVGTWLRECWKRDPATTERFLRRYAKDLSPMAITVATERAPKRFREELRRRHRDVHSPLRRRL